MPRSLSRSPSYRRRYSPPPVAHRHSRRSKREGSRSRSRSPFSNSHSRRRSHSSSPRRRRNRSPSYRRRKSRSPTPRKHNKRQGSSSRSLSPVSKSSGPSSTSSERKNAIEKLKKEEEEKKRLVCKMSNRKDPAWKYGVEVETDGGKAYKYIRCTFCEKIIKGGVFRMKQHLAGIRRNVAPCTRVSDEVRDEIKSYMTKNDNAKNTAQLINFTSQTKGGSSSGSVSQLRIGGPMDRFVMNIDEDEAELRGNNKQGSEEEAGSKEEARDRTSMDIAKFFFENGIAFNVASSPSFINMCRSVGNYGRGLKPPTSCELSTTILKEEESNTQAIVAEVKKTWTQTGVSIIFDGWKDMRGRHLINLLVNNPHGTIFLRSVDASDVIKDAKLLFKLLNEVVEEVGEELVVQVVTDNTSNYKAAGEMLMEKRPRLWWTPHQLEVELKLLEEETARRLEEAIRRNVEQRLNSEEAKLEVVRRIEEGREKLFNDIVTQLEKEKEVALMEARQKEEQARREREELDKMLEENKRRVEEAQRREALEQQRKEEERHRELELIQRQKEEAARRKKLEEEEEQRANQMKSSVQELLLLYVLTSELVGAIV
ncbi:hypothetical protein Q3G72_011444 [Acer saccharum]|nr:hypothetical protein Q3G72_011444 [Acer saccharum]